MKRVLKRLSGAIVLLWAVLVFLASNSPDEVASRTAGWLSLPLVRTMPAALFSVAKHPVTLAMTFLGLGGWIGWTLHKFVVGAAHANPWKGLGVEAQLMGHAVDQMSSILPNNAVVGRLNLILGKLRANGFAVPPGPQLDRNQMSLYLHQVGAYLSDGNLAAARDAARHLSQARASDALSGY
jgi:hypothetical protein